MYILYADDAGNTGTDYDNKQQPVFSLAGIIVKDSNWSVVNDKINDLKRRIIPESPVAEIHATDIFNGKRDKKGRFDFRRNSPEQNRAILSAFVDFVSAEQLPILYFSVRKANFSVFSRTTKKYSQKKSNRSHKGALPMGNALPAARRYDTAGIIYPLLF